MTNKEAINELAEMGNTLQIIPSTRKGQALEMAIKALNAEPIRPKGEWEQTRYRSIDQTGESYDDGYEDGYEDGKLHERNFIISGMPIYDLGYGNGLNEAWEYMRKLMLSPEDGGIDKYVIKKIFGMSYYDVLKIYSASKVISKINELKSLENNESMPDWLKPTIKKVRETMEMDGRKNIYGEWIPVSERLPEEREWYLAVFKEKDTNFQLIPRVADYIGHGENKWRLIDEEGMVQEYFDLLECVAWMPLPEPYYNAERGD